MNSSLSQKNQGLDEKDIRGVATRSFFLQALWNYQKLQNLGWAWTLLPALKKLYPNKLDRLSVLKRHLEYFNTHPYVAGVILGVSLKMEQNALLAGEDAAAPVDAVRKAMMGPLAALGDVFFWSTLRPLAAMAGVEIYFLGGAHAGAAAAACAALLFVFNGPHLISRYRGPQLGFSYGSKMVTRLRQIDVARSVARANRVGLIVLAALAAGLGRFRFPGVETSPMEDNLLFFGAGILMLVALRFKVGAVKILLILLGVSLLAASLEPFTAMGN